MLLLENNVNPKHLTFIAKEQFRYAHRSMAYILRHIVCLGNTDMHANWY